MRSGPKLRAASLEGAGGGMKKGQAPKRLPSLAEA